MWSRITSDHHDYDRARVARGSLSDDEGNQDITDFHARGRPR
jgi:hypothetical protein